MPSLSLTERLPKRPLECLFLFAMLGAEPNYHINGFRRPRLHRSQNLLIILAQVKVLDLGNGWRQWSRLSNMLVWPPVVPLPVQRQSETPLVGKAS